MYIRFVRSHTAKDNFWSLRIPIWPMQCVNPGGPRSDCLVRCLFCGALLQCLLELSRHSGQAKGRVRLVAKVPAMGMAYTLIKYLSRQYVFEPCFGVCCASVREPAQSEKSSDQIKLRCVQCSCLKMLNAVPMLQKDRPTPWGRYC